MHMYIYIHIYIYMYVCVYVYMLFLGEALRGVGLTTFVKKACKVALCTLLGSSG